MAVDLVLLPKVLGIQPNLPVSLSAFRERAPGRRLATIAMEKQPAPASPVLSWLVATPADRDLLMSKTSDVALGPFFAGFAVSSLGFVLFYYGKRMKRAPQLATGLVLMVYPYFVPGVLAMFAIAAVLVFAMWLAIQRGL